MHKDIDISSVRPNPTNPRKTIDPDKLDDLAASIRAHGVLQPILVRPFTAYFVERYQATTLIEQLGLAEPKPSWCVVSLLAGSTVEEEYYEEGDARKACVQRLKLHKQRHGDEYELVAGERRWRASDLAGCGKIPADVRELTDRQVLEIQVIENEQRDDIAPLEKADAYARLMEAFGVSVEEIAEKTGKSKATIYGLVKLRALSEPARKALADGELNLSTAQLAARIPNAELRDEFARRVAKGLGYGQPPAWDAKAGHDGPMRFRDARDLLHRLYQVELKKAPFSRKALDLVEGETSCDLCPKRTGNMADADQGGRADVCTDPNCFRLKEAAYRDRSLAKLSKQGIQPVEDGIAQQMRWYDGQLSSGTFTALDSTPDYMHDKPKDERLTYAELVGAMDQVKRERCATIDDKGKARIVVSTKVLEKALEDAGLVNRAEREKTVREPGNWEIERKAGELVAAKVAETARELLAGCFGTIGTRFKPMIEVLRLMGWAAAFEQDGHFVEAEGEAVDARLWSEEVGVEELVAKMLQVHAADAMKAYPAKGGRELKDSFLAYAGVDWDAACKQAKKELMKPKAKAAKKSKAKA